jgi:tRNA-specific 2-thiouridylase
LLKGRDENKDQSYFLCQISQKQLAEALFPVGKLTKPEVRKIADRLGLATARRKDSQGICFIGKVHLPAFLQQKLKEKKGPIVEIPYSFKFRSRHSGLPDESISYEQLKEIAEPHQMEMESGKVIGTHNGAHFFTIGQRKGINIGGHKEPLFVIGTDVEKNILYVGEGQSHPGLYRKGLFVRSDEVHCVRPDLAMNEGDSRDYMVRIRYRQPLQKAKFFRREDGIYIIFHKLQRGITPGQFAAWYDGDEVIGSGVINK